MLCSYASNELFRATVADHWCVKTKAMADGIRLELPAGEKAADCLIGQVFTLD